MFKITGVYGENTGFKAQNGIKQTAKDGQTEASTLRTQVWTSGKKGY